MMVRRKHVLIALVSVLMMMGVSWAETWDFDLSAGGNSLTGGLHHKTYLDTGYLRFGGSGVWVDENSTEYQWGSVDFMVGSDTLRPGLTCELGLRGYIGSGKEGIYSGDLGAVGFAANVNYLFSRETLIIPLEILGGFVWAPSLMSFRDTDGYSEFNLGAGVRVIKNASIMVTYTSYRVEMKARPTSWVLNDDNIRIGLVMRF